MKKTGRNPDFWSGKRVLVTGGAGFIGSRLVEMLVESEAIVRVSYQDPKKLENLNFVKKKIELVKAELLNPKDCASVVRKQEIILNLAARVAGIEYNRLHPATMLSENMLLSSNMLEASRKENVERFLVVSSACVYPADAPVPTPESEGFNGEPEPTNAGYGWGKRFGELLGQKYAEEFDMKIAIARPFNSYGPRDNFDPKTSHVIPALIRRVMANENPLVVWGDGTPTRAFCYVDDFCRGLMLCAENGVGKGAVNIGTDEEISIKQLVELIAGFSGKKPKIVFDPQKPNGQMRRNCDNAKAKKEIGFEAKIPLKEGLAKTIEWYKENG
ncbi:MAG: NAD-dependent epimerase/dehydratase family protein [Candidatus Micrarchaeota archaeon]